MPAELTPLAAQLMLRCGRPSCDWTFPSPRGSSFRAKKDVTIPRQTFCRLFSKMAIPKRKTIVAVLDDDHSSLSAAESLLDALGFEAALFSSSEEFLASSAATQVDCLLLDIDLGPASG